jgi:mycothiol synthase
VSVRPATRDDRPAIAELFGSVEEAVTGRPSRIDTAVVDGWLQTLSYESNTWLLEAEGALVAAAFAQLHERRGVFAGAVRPSAWRSGHGARLVELAEARLREEGAERVHAWTVAGDTRADELFGAHGYREVRRFWDMAIELREEPPEPAVAVEPFRDDDLRAFHAADEEAFEDHWENQPETFDEWLERQRGKANHDPSLWFLVRDGDEIAAIVRNELREKAGYVGIMGVRRAWRGRGLAKALLYRTFDEFRQRCLTRVTLHVDAESPTGAAKLYESAGMHVENETATYER